MPSDDFEELSGVAGASSQQIAAKKVRRISIIINDQTHDSLNDSLIIGIGVLCIVRYLRN